MSPHVSTSIFDASPADTRVGVAGTDRSYPGLTTIHLGPASLQWDSPAAARDWLTHCLDQLDAVAPAAVAS